MTTIYDALVAEWARRHPHKPVPFPTLQRVLDRLVRV